MHKITINLTDDERKALEQVRDKHKTPYLRERAAAILQVADGESALSVAKDHLLKSRDPDTLYSWIHRYLQEGIDGLKQHQRRVRAFSP